MLESKNYYIYCAFSPHLMAALAPSIGGTRSVAVKIGYATDRRERIKSLRRGFKDCSTGKRDDNPLAGYDDWVFLRSWNVGHSFKKMKEIETEVLKIFAKSGGRLDSMKEVPASVKIGSGATSEIVFVKADMDTKFVAARRCLNVQDIASFSLSFAAAYFGSRLPAFIVENAGACDGLKTLF